MYSLCLVINSNVRLHSIFCNLNIQRLGRSWLSVYGRWSMSSNHLPFPSVDLYIWDFGFLLIYDSMVQCVHLFIISVQKGKSLNSIFFSWLIFGNIWNLLLICISWHRFVHEHNLKKKMSASSAQEVEHLIWNKWVAGSILVRGVISPWQ